MELCVARETGAAAVKIGAGMSALADWLYAQANAAHRSSI
jgi:hypothetical protein